MSVGFDPSTQYHSLECEVREVNPFPLSQE